MQLITKRTVCWAILLVVGAICLLGALSAEAGTEPTPRQKFRLPRLFDFARFKSIFKKSYKSITEELVRQKLFLARAFRTFVAGIKYKHGSKSYYLKINKRSDWTPDEIESSLLHVNSKRQRAESESEPGPAPMATEEEIAAELRRLQEEHKNDPEARDIAAELEGGPPAGRRKRDTSQPAPRSLHRSFSLDNLEPQPEVEEESPEVRAKMKRRVASDNPNYEAPELMSYGAALDDDEAEGDEHEPHDEDYFEKIDGKSKATTFGVNLFNKLSNLVTGTKGPQPAEVNPDLPDELFVDHRKSGCFFNPRSQGNCGSCYSFAYAALLEYFYCKAKGDLVQFSEQYMVDCGYRESDYNSGCDGAPIPYIGDFIVNYGIELRSTYPYVKRQNACPYPENTPKEQMGYLKPNFKLFYISTDRRPLEKVLAKTPLVIGIGTRDSDFSEYGGGVHDMDGCPAEKLDHAVLLVGHGREDGQEYWLIRNSHGMSFGEDGYYKLAKHVNCIFDEANTFGDSRHNFGMDPEVNEESDQKLVKKAGEEIGQWSVSRRWDSLSIYY